MKHLFALTAGMLMLTSITLHAQQSNFINYQTVIRDGGGSILNTIPVTVKFSIRPGTPTATAVYEEEHDDTTNAFGLITVAIGNGTRVLNGNFAAINWDSTDYFLQVQAKVPDQGITSFQDMGTSPFRTVPFAFTAKTAEVSADNQWTKSGNDISNNNNGNVLIGTGNVGIGTINPAAKLHVNGDIQWGGINAPFVFSGSRPSPGGTFIEAKGTSLTDHSLQLQSSMNGDAVNYSQLFINPATGFTFTSNGSAIANARFDGNVGIGTGTSTPTEKVEITGGGIKINQETSSPAENTIYGNSLPRAYGHINSDGTIRTNYGILSCTRSQTGFYRVVTEFDIDNSPVVSITVETSSTMPAVAHFTVSGINNLIVVQMIDVDSRNLRDHSFSIVVYN